MMVPYSKSFLLELTGTDPAVFALGFPPRGRLVNWAMKRTSGNGAGNVTISIYTSEAAAVADDITRRIANKAAALPWVETISAEFVNREGSISDAVRKLYARVVPADGTGAQSYTLELTMETPYVG